MKYLITGGCGFLGSNLASEVLQRKDELFIFDNCSRKGAHDNLLWLQTQGQFKFFPGDIRNANDLEVLISSIKPDVIFHLAGQVAMTTSLANPRLDFEINALGSFNLLESVRKHCPETKIIYSSTNKVYGDFEWVNYQETPTRYIAVDYPEGFSEQFSLDFHSPYGCSKGAADQYMLDYARVFGLNTVVFRHSSIYGGRQYGTYDQGWVSWFVQQAIKTQKGNTEPFTISGNGKQVRDLLFSSDLVQCYFKAIAAMEKIRGNAFNIGGGMNNSLSLLELFDFLDAELGIQLKYDILPWRESDQKIFIADINKAKKDFNWLPQIDYQTGIRETIAWVKTYV